MRIHTKDVEGEFSLKFIEPLQFQPFNFFLHVLLSLFTIGLWGLILTWNIKLRKRMYFKKNPNLIRCTHCFVINKDRTEEILPLKKNETKLFIESKLMKYVCHGNYIDYNQCHFEAVDFLPESITQKEIL